MNDFLSDFLHSIVLLIFTSIFIFLAGHILYSFFSSSSRDKIKSFFIKISCGLISTAILFAIVKTKFETVYTGVIITFLFFLITEKPKISVKYFENLKRIEFSAFICYLITLVFITFGAIYLYYHDNRLFIHHDLAFFASLGYSLHEFGIETINTDPVLTGAVNATLYHYFNEWWIALFMYFSEFPSLKILLTLVLPLFVSVLSSGSLSLTNNLLPNLGITKKLFISWTFLLIPGLFSMAFSILTGFSLHSEYTIFQGGIVIMKVKIVLILLLLFLVDFQANVKEGNYFFLSLIPLFWITLIPAFLGAYILYLLYMKFNREPIDIKSVAKLFVPIIYIPVHFIIINLIGSKETSDVMAGEQYSLINYLADMYTNPYYLAKTAILYIVPVACCYFFILKYYKKLFYRYSAKMTVLKPEYYTIFLLYIFIVFAAVLSFGLLRSLFNARQIIMNLFYPFINIILFLILIYYSKGHPRWITPILVTGYLLVFLHGYFFREGTFNELNDRYNKFSFLSQKEKVLIASDISSDRTPFSLYKKPYSHLLMLNENYKPLRLDLFFDISHMSPTEKLEYLQSVKTQAYYRFVRAEKLSPDSEDSKIRFIENFGIRYLLIDSVKYYDGSSYLRSLQVEKSEVFDNGVLLLTLKEKGY